MEHALVGSRAPRSPRLLAAMAAAALLVTQRLVRGLLHVAYRLDVRGLERLPARGAALLVANHVSYLDAILIGALSPRPIRFVVYHRIHDAWPLRWFFRLCRAIPIAPRREDPARLAAAMDDIAEALEAGEVVGLFPEGRLTRDGAIDRFRAGVERVLARSPVPVYPAALDGLWGSVFSYAGGPPLAKPPRRLRAAVRLRVGAPLAPGRASAPALRRAVEALRG